MSLLIIIPACNEEKRIGKTLSKFLDFFSDFRERIEILVVVNGSTDRTHEIVEDMAARYDILKLLNLDGRIGKGGALIEGFKTVGEVDKVAFVDADGATSPSELARLASFCDSADAVIASRWVKGAVILVEQSYKRMFFSRCFNLFVRILFLFPFRDTQCGAKVMRADWVPRIQSDLFVTDMAFDVNWIFSLRRHGARIVEVPTEWADQDGSKVRLFRTSFLMFISVIRLRWIYSPLRFLRRPFLPIESKIYEWLSR